MKKSYARLLPLKFKRQSTTLSKRFRTKHVPNSFSSRRVRFESTPFLRFAKKLATFNPGKVYLTGRARKLLREGRFLITNNNRGGASQFKNRFFSTPGKAIAKDNTYLSFKARMQVATKYSEKAEALMSHALSKRFFDKRIRDLRKAGARRKRIRNRKEPF